MQEQNLYCEKHNLHYQGFEFGMLGLKSLCPKCEAEQKERRQRQQELEAKMLKEQELRDKIDYLDKFSNIPKRYLSFQVDMSFENFSNHKKLLDEPLQNNLFVWGGIGTGKTLFCTELVKANTKKAPLYLNANDLLFMREWKIAELLDKLDGKGLVVIDEAQIVVFKNTDLLNLIIDKLHRNGAVIVLCGNFTDKDFEIFKSDKFKRITSRIKDGGLKFVEFKGNDLRGEV